MHFLHPRLSLQIIPIPIAIAGAMVWFSMVANAKNTTDRAFRAAPHWKIA
jgi:hypothetical protein